MEPNPLTELKEHSVLVGSNPDLVQASGGNTSWKSGTSIWVKGSGKRLKDAWVEDIFSNISFESLTEDQIISCQDFSTLASNSISPSIEANFHILIKNDFVTHLHSLGAISLSISSESIRSKILDLGISFVPYCRPGVDLAHSIRDTPNFQDNILILQNHGVIFSDSSCLQIEKKIEKFESSVKELFESISEFPQFPDWIEMLVSGILTPDEAVFLGKTPFIASEAIAGESIAINKSGDLLFPDGLSKDRIEMAHFYVRVAKLISKKTLVSYLPNTEVESLLGWDKEVKRIEMAK
jgi:rhamnose utilization protein RhaD (predicted bifunctional aldolase and dehydrogenase)